MNTVFAVPPLPIYHLDNHYTIVVEVNIWHKLMHRVPNINLVNMLAGRLSTRLRYDRTVPKELQDMMVRYNCIKRARFLYVQWRRFSKVRTWPMAVIAVPT